MMSVDWNAVMLGLGIGAVVSAAFFKGLALGMRLALGAAQPMGVLLVSAGLRIMALLGVGWAIVWQAGPWALVAYGTAFFIIRLVATTFVRAGLGAGGTP
ncbi:ATP synthase subunit AtpR [Yoonia sp.]|uniref:ATP synthase subunit AtpR n=1 Tax=Yoonia sp. TaxID=2212373 RepID=UPI0025DCB81F|nr:ATP synthase subunit AtpR [Yoonia sp.]